MKEKLKNKSPRRQVCVKAHHEDVQDCELRGHGNFEWNTDIIETMKLENYTFQVAQGLYGWEAQHKHRGAHRAQRCRSLHETLGMQSLARKFGPRTVDGTNGDDWELVNSDSSRAGVYVFSITTSVRMFTTTHLSDHVHHHMTSRQHQPQKG